MTTFPSGGAGAGAAGAVPTCPRHPGRESYVRCQRCERPVCPECQRPAAVGVQCVDCVREGRRSVRSTRTVFGGRAGSERPLVTQTLIAACVAVFAAQWFTAGEATARLQFVPALALADPWTFLTSAFAHATGFLPHIALNMYALWVLGPYLEGLFGHTRFAALYLLSALGGSVGFLLLASPGSSSWVSGAVGASGAIFGMFAALLIANRRLGRDVRGVVGVIAINLVIGFLPLLGVFGGLSIAWQAHLGGLVTGAGAAALLVMPATVRSAARQVAALSGVLVLLGLLVVAKVAVVGVSAFA